MSRCETRSYAAGVSVTPIPRREVVVLASLGSWCHRRRRLVVALWFGALLGLGAASGAVGTSFQDEFTLPDVESRTGFDILEEDFGGQGAGISGTIVFRAEQGVDDPEVRAAMHAMSTSSTPGTTSPS